MLPGVRWHPRFRTVALRGARGDLVVSGSGPANAVRSGPGVGSAIRVGAGHGNAVRREGAGDAVREGPGHGDAYREGAGEGLAIREGTGHGHAVCRSRGQSGAQRRGASHGNAVAESGREGARRAGSGAGTAVCAPAVRSAPGRGDAVCRVSRPSNPWPDSTALRSGAGVGDAFGPLAPAGRTRRSATSSIRALSTDTYDPSPLNARSPRRRRVQRRRIGARPFRSEQLAAEVVGREGPLPLELNGAARGCTSLNGLTGRETAHFIEGRRTPTGSGHATRRRAESAATRAHRPARKLLGRNT